jgi:type IV pilus assembly protein PilC
MSWKECLGILGTVGGFMALLVLGSLMLIGGQAFGIFLPFVLLLSVVYVWMLFTALHYRYGRQRDLLHLMTTAVESGAPLAPALRAYLADRPHGPGREFWVALLLFFVFPGYYWIWHRQHSYNRKVSEVANLLEDGVSLHESLQALPGVVSPDTLLAVEVGESTGRLALCLRSSFQGGLGPIWLEILPRMLYPLVLLLFISLITSFWMVFLLPKMKKIFLDHGMKLPHLTEVLVNVGDVCSSVLLIPILFMGVLGPLLLGLSPTFCWHCPGIGWLYRMRLRSRVLKMLSIMLETGLPAPEALGELAESGFFPGVVSQRLEAASAWVEQGEPLADSLCRAGLLSSAMVSVVQAAERMRNLPWVLSELGDSLAGRTVRYMRRLSQIIAPLSVVAVGLLVGLIVLGMFLPLVKMIEGLSQ